MAIRMVCSSARPAVKAASEHGKKLTRHKSQDSVREGVKRSSGQIETKKLWQAHFHASGQRRGHRVYARNEFCDYERELATFVERLCRAQNAGFRIYRDFAEESKQRPSHLAAEREKHHIAQQHRDNG